MCTCVCSIFVCSTFKLSSRYSSNYEENASELLENFSLLLIVDDDQTIV